jgi:hypothetical protein
VYGVPILNFLGQYLRRQQRQQVEELIVCLIDAGVEKNGKSSDRLVNAPAQLQVYQHLPLLLQALEISGGRIMWELTSKGADVGVTYELSSGKSTGITPMHRALMLDTSEHIQGAFQREGLEQITQMGTMMASRMIEGYQAKDFAKEIKRAVKSFKKRNKAHPGKLADFKQGDLQTIVNAEVGDFIGMLVNAPSMSEQSDEEEHRDMFGRTPLHYAAKMGNGLAASLLLSKLPQCRDVKDDAGWTALDVATYFKRKDVIQQIMQTGAEESTMDTSKVHKDDGVDDVRAVGDGGWAPEVEDEHLISHCDIDERCVPMIAYGVGEQTTRAQESE